MPPRCRTASAHRAVHLGKPRHLSERRHGRRTRDVQHRRLHLLVIVQQLHITFIDSETMTMDMVIHVNFMNIHNAPSPAPLHPGTPCLLNADTAEQGCAGWKHGPQTSMTHLALLTGAAAAEQQLWYSVLPGHVARHRPDSFPHLRPTAHIGLWKPACSIMITNTSSALQCSDARATLPCGLRLLRDADMTWSTRPKGHASDPAEVSLHEQEGATAVHQGNDTGGAEDSTKVLQGIMAAKGCGPFQ